MIIFLLLIGILCGSEIELFCDYAWDAKGQEMFPIEGASLPSMIRRRLNEQGDDIRSWEIERYLSKPAVPSTTKYWIFWNLGPKLKPLDFGKVPKEKLVLFMWEPPTVQPELYDPKIQAHFGKIFTWDDDLVDNKKFFKLHYPTISPKLAHIPSFEEKKFCTMICRRLTSDHPKELYSERRRAIKFFENKELDLYGYGWKPKIKNYRGSIDNKLETLKMYKFSICYENTKDVKGYISEKIFDCFIAGVVPIYLGASNVTDYIPADCFIDKRKFASYEDLYKHLKSMTKKEYQTYIERAEKFLCSEKAKVFTHEYFVENFLSKLNEESP